MSYHLTITNTLGEPIKFIRMLDKTCATCARGAKLGVVWESYGQSMTAECENCGAQCHLPWTPTSMATLEPTPTTPTT